MVGSVSSNNASGLLTALMKQASIKQNLEVSVVKKAQDVEKMQGEAALKLIEAANVAEPGRIDIHV